MKGIILAGGRGTRLSPLTKTENKHLLPVYNRKMIEYPLLTLTNAGIKDIVIVTGGNKPGSFIEYLGDGKEFNCSSLTFTYQDGNDGIVSALKCAESVCVDDDVVVILGDNYFEDGIISFIKKYRPNKNIEAFCLLHKVETPFFFGIAELNENNEIISIEEKPSSPKSNYAILGCYIFSKDVWNQLDYIRPSNRGEFEITDVLSVYMRNKKLSYDFYEGYWSDMGTFETWTEVSKRVALRESK